MCWLVALLVACHPSPEPDAGRVRREIEAVIASEMAANRAKDIDAFLAPLDDSFVLAGHIDKAAMRADILRDWSVITEMVDVRRWITKLEVTSADTAIVFTDQRYERKMSRPDPNDHAIDDVVTTQRHEEHWVRRPTGWKIAAIKELGGEIYVNGKPYSP